MLRNFGADYAETEQLHRVIDKRDLGSPVTVVNHICSNDMRKTRNLDFKWEKYMRCWLRQRGNSRNAEFPEWSAAT